MALRARVHTTVFFATSPYVDLMPEELSGFRPRESSICECESLLLIIGPGDFYGAFTQERASRHPCAL